MIRNREFTSESVSCGHPDKVADQISDRVLDTLLGEDPEARVACEVLVKTGMVLVAGEISTHAWADIETLVRDVLVQVGYTDPKVGFDAYSCAVLSSIGKQSPDISSCLTQNNTSFLGAGDQGLMFGYACQETDVLMPAAIHWSHQLMKAHAKLRTQPEFSWLKPDAKTQITCAYDAQGKPTHITRVVLSTQHAEEVTLEKVRETMLDHLIRTTLPSEWLRDDTVFHINPSGRFVIGGPQSDCGLTGRKIIVDSYGGYARHGGGAFSGKDPTKVDRSAAYFARYVAKNVVAAGLAEVCELQVAYAIGREEPMSVAVDTYGSGRVPDEVILKAILKHFDFRPAAMIERLNLKRPIYSPTATYGHFGRSEPSFTWEALDVAPTLKQAVA